MNRSSSPVRVVNNNLLIPHVVNYNSNTYIIPPKDGSVWRKIKTRAFQTKQIFDKKTGEVERTKSKATASTEFKQVFADAAGSEVLVGLVTDEDGTIRRAKAPVGCKPVIKPFSNHCDLPPDAAAMVLYGEYREMHPETQKITLLYHGGDLIRLEDDHDQQIAAQTAALDMQAELEAKNAVLEEAIKAKEAEIKRLADEHTDAVAKTGIAKRLLAKAEATRGASTTADSAGPPSP